MILRAGLDPGRMLPITAAEAIRNHYAVVVGSAVEVKVCL